MTHKKFEEEVNTLKDFFECYCKDKHECSKIKITTLEYQSKIFYLELHLCDECQNAIHYSFFKLQNCSHEIKPRCRKCPTPCYEKQEWKNTAKIMIYSAVKLSLSKMKNRIRNVFS
ncbi:MAG: nitrous oxide-stimulated promoter family protein [Aliarcobacter sp.]|nr:nitrous oxide-stimulated promoter family protein [Aliarcobacter sp.]